MGKLNAEQALAVNHTRGPMLVLAGPGSGKTHTLVERIKNLVEKENIDPRKILTITFSKKAALEMQARFKNLIGDKNYPVTFGTFHATFYHILQIYKNYSKDSILTPLQKKKYLNIIAHKNHIEELLDENVKNDYLQKISYFKSNNMSDDEKAEHLALNDEEKNRFLAVYNEYLHLCRNDGKIDFDDMLLECLKLLKNNRTVLNQWRGIYQYFLVDEFQDINDVQYEALTLLAGDDFNIFAVGDDDQSIYGFRGSKPSIMKEFLGVKDCKVVNLNKNYRCAEPVINVAGKLINVNSDRIDKCQTAAKPDKDDGFVKLLCVENSDIEAETVINLIKENCYEKEDKLYSTAVLYRNKKCADILEEKLLMEKIPYDRKNEKSDFYETDIMLDLIAYFRVCTGTGKRSDYYRIINKPERGLTREAFTEGFSERIENIYDLYPDMNIIWKKLLKDFKMLEDLPCFAAVNYLFKGMGYEKYLRSYFMKRGTRKEEINDFIDEIFNRSRSFDNVLQWLLYIDELNYMKNNGVYIENGLHNQDENGIKHDNNIVKREESSLHKVVLQTMHASKGLEYDNVFIIGLQEGICPHKKAVTDAQLEEERRLLYVAITRAKKRLFIIGKGDNEHGKHVSRFVSEINDIVHANT